MKETLFTEASQEAAKEVLGYLNFSSGVRDTRFLSALNTLFGHLPPERIDRAKTVLDYLSSQLSEITGTSETFRNAKQAAHVIDYVRNHFFAAFREFHKDLLFHHTDDTLFQPFFVGRVFEVALSLDVSWEIVPKSQEEIEKITDSMINQMNDLLGYRPIPVLEGEEKHQPNAHEWVAPIPLYIRGAGAASGKYEKVVQRAIEILEMSDPNLLREAWFDIQKLEELVLDPRAYDFDHPVNRRPNYHFGTWDMNTIDNNGFYTRFVIHQVTLEGIVQRYETAYTGESEVSTVPEEEIIYEAGAVLAGTMLMGSGVCGDSPHAHDSSVTLMTLMPQIAAYRDKFYEALIKLVPKKLSERLKKEEDRLHQPFGGARQDLNKRLAKRRADQLQRLHLARTYARMGYFEAAKKQAEIISVASARILCQIDCLITQSHFLADRKNLAEATALLPVMEELMMRGVACGALVDPWTILGFGAQYSLFPAVDNSVHDHRVDDLIHLLDDIFDLYSRLQKEAAASGDGETQSELSDKMSDLAGWWDQFGSVEVSSVEGFSGQAAWESAAKVSTALAAWHQAGTAAGDIAFWSRHVERFNSPKAFVLLGEALLDQRDQVASMALLMYWLNQTDTIPLMEGDYSFHSISLRWMESLWKCSRTTAPTEKATEEAPPAPKNRFLPKQAPKPKAPEEEPVAPLMSFSQCWELTKKFFDYMEANADKYWHVPTLELDPSMFESERASSSKPGSSKEFFRKLREKIHDLESQNDEGERTEEDEEFFRSVEAHLEKELLDEDEDYSDEIDALADAAAAGVEGEEEDEDSRGIDPLFSAAYENVTYKDTADDGFDEDTVEGQSTPFRDNDELELTSETDRISDRLAFLVTLFKLWKYAAGKSPVLGGNAEVDAKETAEARESLENWLNQVRVIHKELYALLHRTSLYKVPAPKGTQESLMEYDHHRGTKEVLLDRIVWTIVEASDTALFLQAMLGDELGKENEYPWQQAVEVVFSYAFRSDVKNVKRHWGKMLRILSKESLLYIPTSRGGDAKAIVKCRCLQQVILRLLEYGPRLGLLTETFQLLDTIQTMEQTNTLSRPGAITEFDRLVETATRSMTNCIAESSKGWRIAKDDDAFSDSDHALVDYLERIIELILACWLGHSRQIRISPVESISDKATWADVKKFVMKYGHDIFTQQFMGFGNLRAVLHQGVENYLRALVKMREEDDDDLDVAVDLVDDLRSGQIPWAEASYLLEVIFESVAENYSEYIDYNSTTTHSDRGEKLYMLLDMLRVLTGYERISWNLKPVYWVHDSMIRAKCASAADLWEKAVARRSYNAAEEHLRHYNRLSEKYGMWLPSVHERLQERFIRPLQVDRMCGLVPQAVREAREDGPKESFAELEKQIDNFAREPLGVGFEMPEWLSALQEEVMSTRIDNKEGESSEDAFSPVPNFSQIRLTRKELDRQIDSWGKHIRFV